ncbi:LON peptidase N-terminal domain and RING finger protein 1 [Scaptodrosophila lebanonensis]|uniref:LON peptidase N-terminal domain and RING finger protein 1 n=1 Tax=Drosophila lebanonensis TaxID=7225 RepID=A0A6J2UBI3_DROLE|nr:LON peptidase N-terminal domain and RING finger protein 1 [Scaptodrosophila lebanonensis]
MSKSVAEQYQIKKKRRKHITKTRTTADDNCNRHHHHQLNNKNNNNNNNNICYKYKNQIINYKKFKRDENYFAHIERRIRDRGQIAKGIKPTTRAAIGTKITTTTTPTTAAALVTMPLSRGYYVKPSLATKRGGLKPLKLGEAKRSKSHTQENDEILGLTQSSMLQHDSYNQRPKNSLHLTYLLGESLAKKGRLPSAFNVYENIASRQLDGYVPLDKLGVLAHAVTAHIRQLAGHEAAAKARCQSTRQHLDNWTAQTLDLSQHKELQMELDSRELRVSSPAHCEDYDPLHCPLCRDTLRCPVTTNCGHTFCRQCCETITMCNICHVKFPRSADPQMGVASMGGGALTTTTSSSTTASPASRFFAGLGNSSALSVPSTASFPGNFGLRSPVPAPTTVTTTTVASTTATATTTMASTSAAAAAGLGYVAALGSPSLGRTANAMKFMPDVLIRRLVEKWWGADLQAKKINEKASSCMHLNLLDDALKFCNASLEKAPTNFKSLCLRAEVLLKLSHFQSSLADIENALKTRCTSPKAHYLRALALSGLGRLEEALYNGFLAICLDKTTNLSSSELFQHDLAKILQRLLAQTPKSKADASAQPQSRSYGTKMPYAAFWELHMRKKQHGVMDIDVEDEFGISFDKPYDDNYIMADEESGPLHMDGDFLFSSALDFMDQHNGYDLHNAKEFDLQARRHATRKHCRRKWPQINAEQLLPAMESQQSRRCSRLFGVVLERIQQELQRLKKLESSKDAPHKQLTSVQGQQIDASDFDCVLCCRTLWKPVVTPCGHTYCLVCLDRCMDYNSSCPLCMSPLVELNVNNNLYQGSSSPVPFALAKRPVTKFLEAAMKRFIPDHYEARFRQEIDQEPSVPVFICTAAFPSVPCPLFVYDPRYRLMVRRAVESGEKTFGIVQPHGGKSRYYDVGTILDIRDCVLLGDGCSILSTIGCKRFKILARSEKDGYETAKVEYICDEPIAPEQVKAVASMHAQVLCKASGWFESLSTEQKHEILQSYGEMPPLEPNWELITDGPAWAWWIIALLPLSQQLKVDILATTSLEKRLRAIDKTLDWLELSQQQHQQQTPQSPQQQPHDLSLDCEEQRVAVEGIESGAAAGVDECCLYADASEPHTDEELLL